MDLLSFFFLIVIAMFDGQVTALLHDDDRTGKVARFDSYQECESAMIKQANDMIIGDQIIIRKIAEGRKATTVASNGGGTYGLMCDEFK